MNIKLQPPKLTEMRPRLTVIGVGGAGGNAINNMIASGLTGVEFVAANTDAQALAASSAEHRIQLGVNLTEGLGAGSKPEIGEAAAEEAIDEIRASISGSHMVFIAAGMGGGTGTGASAVVARVAKELGVLSVGIVTKPFQFEGARRMRVAEAGIAELKKHIDTLIVIPNQNLFRIAGPKTTFAEAFVLADQVLYAGIACIVDLIIKEGLINLDFADIRTILTGMGTAMMGTGEAEGDRRATRAAEEAITNPLLDDVTLKGAKGVVLSVIGGRNMTLFEVDEAASRVRKEVDPDANIILGATFDESLGDKIRVSIVASGMSNEAAQAQATVHSTAAPLASATPVQPGQAAPEAAWVAVPPLPQPDIGSPPVVGSPKPSAPRSQLPPPLPPSAVSSAQPDVDPDSLARALSEAIRSPSRPAAAASAQTEVSAEENAAWKAPGDVIVRPGLVSFGHQQGEQPASRLPHEPPAQQRYDAAAFAPQPPAEVRRTPPRVPPIEEFPQVGQHEYRVKSAQYGERRPASAGETSKASGTTDERRGGWFSRIGFGRRSDEAAGGGSASDSGRINDAVRQAAPSTRPHASTAAGAAASAPDQDSDLPQIFSSKASR